ncbi:hypothetical protein [Methanogenium cariaci]|uniref:hypothetical protein n=1 Tax=Methanogenium cariaci TaxID=2197 RepID=UPI001FE0C2DA|nr:hypothetical protein [Methanogenium cariaci]
MTDPHTGGVVQIGTGCLGSCGYCVTRLARGPLKSFSADAIVAEVERLAALGAYEIQLTGQDVSAWGMDIGRTLPICWSGLPMRRGGISVSASA